MRSARPFVIALALIAAAVGALATAATIGLRCFDQCPTTWEAELRADAPIVALGVYTLASLGGALAVGQRARLATWLLLAAAVAPILLGLALSRSDPNAIGYAAIPAMAAMLAWWQARRTGATR